ncbi:MAG: hypothetical protein GEU79_05375 [Acidimicrobiia bacterium]|nr:hypothetical protein [Acidimicrobiia bacterium]
MMESLAATVWVFAALLVVTGVLKIVRPTEVERALRSVDVPAAHGSGRVLGAAEVVVGVAVFLIDGPLPAVALTLLYLGFGVFVVVALRSGGVVRSCGCVGKADTPPNPLHVILNVLGVVSGGAAVSVGSVIWESGPVLESAVAIAMIGIAIWLAYSIVALPISWKA